MNSKTIKSALLPQAGTSKPADIELAGSLRTVISRLVKVLRKETRNEEMLSITERSSLGLLDLYPGSQPTDLAAMEKVTNQSMSQVINHLFRLGYVRRTPSPDDGRKVLLFLTPSGAEYVDRARQERQEWLARMIGERLNPGEKEILLKASAILKKLIEE